MSAQAQTRSALPPSRRISKREAPADRGDTRDYCAIALAYAKSAALQKNQKRFGRWMKLACARFLADLQRAKSKVCPFYFDKGEARNACDFIEKLPHVEGNWETPTIRLHESDIFFIVQLFGFRMREDDTRRFTAALKAVARKNAKSTIAAAIGLYCETCEGENGPQVVSAATTGSQARIVFNIAHKMVLRTSALRDAFGLESFANAIACYSNAGTFKPINSKASTQDGLNPSCTIIDEVHAHKDHDLINVLRSAAGARANPLLLYTTTEGYDNVAGPWSELRHFVRQLLLGVLEADHFLVVVYALDEEDRTAGIKADDDFDEETWHKANPLMDSNPLLLKEIRKEAVEAKQMPGRLAEFRIKRLNRSSAATGAWVNLTKWRQCNQPLDAEKLQWLKQYPCYGGIDLSSVDDLASFRLLWIVDDWLYTKGWRFVPRMSVAKRREKGLVPYGPWVEQGFLIEAGDEVIDYDVIESVVLQAQSDFSIKSIAYDPWNAKQFVKKLQEKGVPLEPFIQGPKSYHPATQALERAYISGKLVHGNDPVLNWCASNLIMRTDANMNQAPDKKRAPEKIDDMVALLEAIGIATAGAASGEANVDSWLRS